ncbi:MAG: L-lactate dehydrogenase [Magnetospirillum sp.]
MPVVTSPQDFRALARRRVPRAIFDYVDGGSYDELTLAANSRDLDSLRLRQRVMVDVSIRAKACRVAEAECSMPVVLAPTGLAGLVHARGEILAAQAAEAEGVPFCLSTVSICSMEEVAAATTKPFWFQLYFMKDRDFVGQLIARAAKIGCSALVLTVDLPVTGQRHRDIRNGLSVPPRLTLPTLLDLATKPGWGLRMLAGRRWNFGNLVGHIPKQPAGTSMAQWISGQFEPSMGWADVAWIKSQWQGPLIIKGVTDPDDARAALDAGADAIVVSNHGGRQLDGGPSSIAALPGVVKAVGGRADILVDGAIRGGHDVLKALALGAKATMMGRAFLYGLGAQGGAGVTKVLELTRKELDIAMALTGTNDVTKAGAHTLFQQPASL